MSLAVFGDEETSRNFGLLGLYNGLIIKIERALVITNQTYFLLQFLTRNDIKS